MFDFILSKNGTPVLERNCVRGEVVVAALQLLGIGEVLTVSISDPKEKRDE